MKTMLYERHKTLGAKWVEFGGWEMPLYYTSTLAEHQAVRSTAGLFDISHMARIDIEGPDAESLLEYLSTNHISGKAIGTATYTLWCNPEGGCIEDLLVYKRELSSFFIVVNASNRNKVFEYLISRKQGRDVQITDHFHDGILALQGPRSLKIFESLIPQAASLKPMHFFESILEGESLIVSRTGYTGETGLEIFASAKHIAILWDMLLEKGKPFELQPVGLGARDTLRLEMGYALYGHELKEEMAATETVSAWTIKWDKEGFVGKKALQAIKETIPQRFQYGVMLAEKAIPRQGCPVYDSDRVIGEVTSGNFSPTLQQPIAIVHIEGHFAMEKDTLFIEIRGKRYPAKIVPLPFLK